VTKNRFQELLKDVDDYYSGKVRSHGATPKGVDWKDESSQLLRFKQLEKLFLEEAAFSLNDVGCGYGSMFERLAGKFLKIQYHGADISKEMVKAAREKFGKDPRFHVCGASEELPVSDFTVASGIFNVRLKQDDAIWKKYVESTLELMNEKSRKGFAFNMLTSFSDKEKMRPDLYYADPMYYFDLCKRVYSKQVALLHDYGLYEFTLIIRKET
jgi:SAM-dependent methyltransferase